jgi:hypothetical protein
MGLCGSLLANLISITRGHIASTTLIQGLSPMNHRTHKRKQPSTEIPQRLMNRLLDIWLS